jgi:general secretion pathway protein A
MNPYQHFFAFQKEPFAQDIPISELYLLPDFPALRERFDYSLHLGAISILTGEIGCGKSTSLRWVTSALHPSEYKILPLVAHSGSLREFLKLLAIRLDCDPHTSSLTRLFETLRAAVSELLGRNQRPVLIIDEAHLLRSEVFSHLHTLMQYDFDSKPALAILLAGQNEILDKLHLLSARSLASRVVARTHLESLKLQQTQDYLRHHLEIAGCKKQLFSEEAIPAIHQGSGGLLRKANILARGALIAAAREKSQLVSAEHVRIASTEVI